MATAMPEPIEIPLADGADYVQLCDLLKIAGLSDSGGAAKHAVSEGQVTVDGVVETRKRCKIRVGQVAAFEGKTVKVVPAETAPPAVQQ